MNQAVVVVTECAVIERRAWGRIVPLERVLMALSAVERRAIDAQLEKSEHVREQFLKRQLKLVDFLVDLRDGERRVGKRQEWNELAWRVAAAEMRERV